MIPSRRHWLGAGLGGLAVASLGACRASLGMNPSYYPTKLSMNELFDKPKWMCFGRYAVELPQETEQVFGSHAIAGGFKRLACSDFPDPADLLQEEWRKVLLRARSSELLKDISPGPTPSAKYIWFHEGDFGRRKDVRMLDGAIRVGRSLYLYEGLACRDSRLSPDAPEALFAKMTALMRGMRAWDGVEVPREPGVCIDGAFIHEPTNRFQEIMSSGFYFPSLPDVSFSVMSNKNASVEGDNGHGLLQRVDEARREQMFYPYTFLRRGKRTLHGLWDGEEVLARRSDGALIFDWELVGEPGNPARPSWFEMGFRTRVANNQVGAAETTSISDEQAVALWDRLLDNVKFRVAVPGATPQAVARL